MARIVALIWFALVACGCALDTQGRLVTHVDRAQYPVPPTGDVTWRRASKDQRDAIMAIAIFVEDAGWEGAGEIAVLDLADGHDRDLYICDWIVAQDRPCDDVPPGNYSGITMVRYTDEPCPMLLVWPKGVELCVGVEGLETVRAAIHEMLFHVVRRRVDHPEYLGPVVDGLRAEYCGS